VDDAAGVAALVRGDALVALEDDDPGAVVAALELARGGEADDAGPDDADVGPCWDARVHTDTVKARSPDAADSIVKR
jgi:hypothetical protein